MMWGLNGIRKASTGQLIGRSDSNGPQGSRGG
jgi:hypothetical protein